ncbi:MAG: CoB--CoM heterodisulfide reductase iron-sulfur subunit A family protein [Candidatus Lokiarchaeota archaeon]|nr:CoB--CoM heterodisulfide reductase iron-sulfur subunit A family protein [Candidatus Lokiarchaeota archaeon]
MSTAVKKKILPSDDFFSISDEVLVVGSGAAGMQASLDLSQLGARVILVERNRNIGGLIAKLDKTYATHDCAGLNPLYAIENPWVSKCLHMSHGACGKCHIPTQTYNNPQIKIFQNSTVTSINYIDDGNIQVKIEKQILGIDEDLCNNCGECYVSCPVRFDEDINWFNAGLGTRRAVNQPFPGAVPPVHSIERDRCLHMTKGICGKCQDVCPTGAVTYVFKKEVHEFTVGAIIFATGADQAHPFQYDKFLGHHPDVLNALQFERMASENGPTKGQIIKLSNHQPAKRIAFVQCVGSRNMRPGGMPYCSTVCCMYAIKEADMAKEKDPACETYIFNVENRAYLKGFHEYYLRAKREHGVKFIQGRVASVRPGSSTNELSVEYEDVETGQVKSMPVDLVVLATALVPNVDGLSKILNIPLNKYHFFDKAVADELEHKGIYFAGFCMHPMDIPSSVITADAAVAKVSRRLFHVLHAKHKAAMEESDLDEGKVPAPHGEPRIGVLACQCDKDAAKLVDAEQIKQEIGVIPGVVAVDARVFDRCTESSAYLASMIRQHKLNRVVVGACTPRTHGTIFTEAVKSARLDPSLLEMVNIREQASWVHRGEPDATTRKVIDLLAMGVAKSKDLKYQESTMVSMTKSVLIIGGGPAGIFAADNIASQDIKVYLVEWEDVLGGATNKISRRFLFEDEQVIIEKIEAMVARFPKNQNIKVLLRSRVVGVSGFVGNFRVRVASPGKEQVLQVGAIIVATGASQDAGFANVVEGSRARVFNQEQFEQLLIKGNLHGMKKFAFIQCTNQRADGNIKPRFNNCSGICCKITLKQAIKIKDLVPDAEIHVIQRGMQLSGEVYYEDVHHRVQSFAAMERYSPENYPRIIGRDDGARVLFTDRNVNEVLDLDMDAVILATPYRSAPGTRELGALLKVPVMQAGFFLEAHVKFRPNDFVVDGMFLAGDAHWPKSMIDAVSHGLAAAARATAFLMRGHVTIERTVAFVDEKTCIGCRKCHDACPFDAIDMVTVPMVIEGNQIPMLKARVNPILCKGCGTCTGGCPTHAVDQQNMNTGQLSGMIKVLFPVVKEG